ncbi:MAG TPA: hypothetical protein VFM48_08590 [Aquabacterium sp.]|nr:hypothetical protein [Aquabacterium sp.]
MKIVEVTLTLAELQEAVREYLEKRATSQVELVRVESYRKEVLVIGMRPGEMVEGIAFRRRAEAE